MFFIAFCKPQMQQTGLQNKYKHAALKTSFTATLNYKKEPAAWKQTSKQ